MTLHLTRRGRLVRFVVLAAAGLSFGVLVSAINHGFGPASGYVSKVVGNAGVWLVMGLAACLLGRGLRNSWWCGVVFLWPAVLGYYLTDIASGVYTSTPLVDASGPPQLDLLGAVADIVGYVVISALASAVLAVVVLTSRRGGVVGLLGTVAVPGYVAYDALMSHHRSKALPLAFLDPAGMVVSWYLGVMALAVTALLVVVHLGRSVRSRRDIAADRVLP